MDSRKRYRVPPGYPSTATSDFLTSLITDCNTSISSPAAAGRARRSAAPRSPQRRPAGGRPPAPVVQEGVAPADGVLQGVVLRRGGRVAPNQHREPLVGLDAMLDLLETHHVYQRGREPDRQRDSVQALANRRDVARLAGGDREILGRAALARSMKRRAASEACNSSWAAPPPAASAPVRGRSFRRRPPNRSWLVARMPGVGQARSRCPASCAHAARMCSQLSRSSRCGDERSRPIKVWDRDRPASSRALRAEGHGLRQRLGIGEIRQLHEPDAARKGVERLSGHLEGEPRLAATARAGEREQVGVGQ